jgi:hypothetical protein
MAVTYYVALPFVRTEDGVAPGEAQEMPSETAAIRRAEAMARGASNAGALAFKRSGDPGMGSFSVNRRSNLTPYRRPILTPLSDVYGR